MEQGRGGMRGEHKQLNFSQLMLPSFSCASSPPKEWTDYGCFSLECRLLAASGRMAALNFQPISGLFLNSGIAMASHQVYRDVG